MLASGGVRHPPDVARGLALGAAAVGASRGFLRFLLDGGVPALTERISTSLDQLAAITTALGAKPGQLARCDVLTRGELRSFCADRGIDTRRLAGRSTG